MSEMFKVQDNWKLPDVDHASSVLRRNYPIDNMLVGQMFFMPGRNTKSVSAYISRTSKGMKETFSTRHVWAVQDGDEWKEATPETKGATEGTGVWRTA